MNTLNTSIVDDALIQSLMERYGIDEETAKHVADIGMNQAVNVLQNASKHVKPYSTLFQATNDSMKPLISFRHLQQSFGKVAQQFTVKSRLPSVLRAAGDGNCAMTTMAIAIELDVRILWVEEIRKKYYPVYILILFFLFFSQMYRQVSKKPLSLPNKIRYPRKRTVFLSYRENTVVIVGTKD
jgi:hypothetical protein